MFDNHNSHHGANNLMPLMVMPNGQVIFGERPQSPRQIVVVDHPSLDGRTAKMQHKARWFRWF